jgi:uracil-DNA glycosylase
MTGVQALPPFAAWSGPRQAKLVLVGEAWGESEATCHRPFAGESGKELWRMLGQAIPDVAAPLHSEVSALHKYGLAWVQRREAWLEAAGIGMTNVLALRPPGNKLEALCVGKKELAGASYDWPPIARGLYLRPEYLPELDRLFVEITNARPNLIVCLGNTACWALLRATNIGSIRGTVTMAQVGEDEWKALPTYHPAGVLRQWAWRPIVVADLIKAWREAQFPEVRRPARAITVNPSIEEVEAWTVSFLATEPALLSCDIETGQGQIKCIGFAPSVKEALVVPFVDLTKPTGSYWPTLENEWRAWQCVKTLLESPVPKLWQNGVYDLQYIMRMGLRPRACAEDTMLLHHSLWPEMQKGLGFLSSVYTNESSWKLMRKDKSKEEGEKADE